MKRILCAMLALTMIFAASACGRKPNEKAQEAPVSAAEKECDVDLTKLSSTMVYSEVYNMIFEPQDYLGKTVKMNGQFAIYQMTEPDGTPVPDRIYYACLIADATACCQQGI